MSRSIYVIGSLARPEIPEIANKLRQAGHDAFDDWWSPGPEADEFWRKHEVARGRPFLEAINGYHAQHVFAFDKQHLDRCDTVLLVLPCGKSGHIEFGYAVGAGKECHVLFPGEPERFDLMYRFAHGLWTSADDLIDGLRQGIRNVV